MSCSSSNPRGVAQSRFCCQAGINMYNFGLPDFRLGLPVPNGRHSRESLLLGSAKEEISKCGEQGIGL